MYLISVYPIGNTNYLVGLQLFVQSHRFRKVNQLFSPISLDGQKNAVSKNQQKTSNLKFYFFICTLYINIFLLVSTHFKH